MAKRQTKAAREAAARAVLKQRLTDIALGAHGPYHRLDFDSEDFGGMASELGLDAFARWLGGIKNALLLEEGNAYLVDMHNVHHFDSMDAAVQHLYGAGVRA